MKIEDNNISIGDLAQQLIQGGAVGRVTAPVVSPAQPEKHLADSIEKVDESFVDLVTGKKLTKKVKVVESKKVDNKKVLVKKFYDKVDELKQIINEMTTCGMLGVNMSAPLGKIIKPKKTKKDSFKTKLQKMVKEGKVNPWAVCHASTGPKKTDKFEKCVRQVKGKNRDKKSK